MENEYWPQVGKIKLVIENGKEFLEMPLIAKDGQQQDLYDIDLWVVKTQEKADFLLEHLQKKRWLDSESYEEVKQYFKEHLEKYVNDNE